MDQPPQALEDADLELAHIVLQTASELESTAKVGTIWFKSHAQVGRVLKILNTRYQGAWGESHIILKASH